MHYWQQPVCRVFHQLVADNIVDSWPYCHWLIPFDGRNCFDIYHKMKLLRNPGSSLLKNTIWSHMVTYSFKMWIMEPISHFVNLLPTSFTNCPNMKKYALRTLDKSQFYSRIFLHEFGSISFWVCPLVISYIPTPTGRSYYLLIFSFKLLFSPKQRLICSSPAYLMVSINSSPCIYTFNKHSSTHAHLTIHLFQFKSWWFKSWFIIDQPRTSKTTYHGTW